VPKLLHQAHLVLRRLIDEMPATARAYRKPHPGVIPRRNRLGWQDDRAVLLRFGRGALTADTGIVLTALVGQMAARRSDF
jgi:hypothetical protein